MANQLWDVGSYNVPQTPWMNPQQAMPTSGWFNNMSPQVKAGLWEPYEQGADLLTERMGAGGQAGSAMGGMSGAYGDAMGRYYGDAQNKVGMQAWQMQQPALQAAMLGNNANNMAGWGAMLGQNKDIWSQQLQQQMFPWQAMMGMTGGGGLNSQPVVSPDSGAQMTQSMMQMIPLIMMMM